MSRVKQIKKIIYLFEHHLIQLPNLSNQFLIVSMTTNNITSIVSGISKQNKDKLTPFAAHTFTQLQ